MYTSIIGAGITGLSTSYHIGHNRCRIFEKSPIHGGHAGTDVRMGFTMDRGPHVSFTKSEYVRNLFSENVGGDFKEIAVTIKNFHKDRWINHPPQCHLWQIAEPLRDQCAVEMIASFDIPQARNPENYQEWLHMCFGSTFAEEFPESYTKKYWTVSANELSCDWIGPRMVRPSKDEVNHGLIPDTYHSKHYISKIRYPFQGGFQSFFNNLSKGADIKVNKHLTSIDLDKQELHFSDGFVENYERIISTIPLPEFVAACKQASPEVMKAASQLDCSQVFLVDVFVPSPAKVEGNWFYIYDLDKISTRIHYLERLSENNVAKGWSGIQVEVYYSKYKPFADNPEQIIETVISELEIMGFIESSVIKNKEYLTQWRWCNNANIIFTHRRITSLNTIWSWLENYGLRRSQYDLDPTIDWSNPIEPSGKIAMAGRYAEWKYMWTDDCILRGKSLAESVSLH